MMYGMKTVERSKTLKAVFEEAEMKLLRLSLEVTRLDKIKNEIILGTMHERQLWVKV